MPVLLLPAIHFALSQYLPHTLARWFRAGDKDSHHCVNGRRVRMTTPKTIPRILLPSALS